MAGASLSLRTPPWGCVVRMFDSISARRNLAARFLCGVIRFLDAAVTIVTHAAESPAEDEATRPLQGVTRFPIPFTRIAGGPSPLAHGFRRTKQTARKSQPIGDQYGQKSYQNSDCG